MKLAELTRLQEHFTPHNSDQFNGGCQENTLKDTIPFQTINYLNFTKRLPGSDNLVHVSLEKMKDKYRGISIELSNSTKPFKYMLEEVVVFIINPQFGWTIVRHDFSLKTNIVGQYPFSRVIKISGIPHQIAK